MFCFKPVEHTDSSLLLQVETAIKSELEDITVLSEAASKHPYYKYVLALPPPKSIVTLKW